MCQIDTFYDQLDWGFTFFFFFISVKYCKVSDFIDDEVTGWIIIFVVTIVKYQAVNLTMATWLYLRGKVAF